MTISTTTTVPPTRATPTIMPSPVLSPASIAMMLADTRLPVGGHVHSAGLEPALLGGMSPAQVPAFMLGRARTVTLVEAGTAVVARHMAGQDHRGGNAPEAVQRLAFALAQVDGAWAARTPSRAVRDVSRSLARGYQRLACKLWATHPAVIATGLPRSQPGQHLSRPVLLGVIAAAAGLDAESLVRLVVYDDAQTIAAAMLKLEPLDPATPPGWVLAACAAAEEFVTDLAALTSADAIPALGAPESEGWAEAHSRTTQRLFRA